MAEPAPETRRFRVHAQHDDPCPARVVEETSFEAAALAYMEDFGDAPGAAEISVIVRSLDDGRERCFTIDLGTGEAASCD